MENSSNWQRMIFMYEDDTNDEYLYQLCIKIDKNTSS